MTDYGICDLFLFFAGLVFGFAIGLLVGWIKELIESIKK